MSVVKERNLSIKPATHTAEFTLGRTSREKSDDKLRQNRRLAYQDRIKKVSVGIRTSDQKQLEAEILKDKLANPFKYNFLGQKGLSDFQIYEEFK